MLLPPARLIRANGGGQRPARRRLAWPAAVLGLVALLSQGVRADPPVLVETRYAQVRGRHTAAGLARTVATLVDEAVPRVGPLVGAADLSPITAVVYADRGEFVSATGIAPRSTIVGLAIFPPGEIHLDGASPLVAIEKLVPHEVAHVMIGRAMGRALPDLPLWLNEGIAEYAAGEAASQVDPVTLRAVGQGEFLPISELDRALRGGGRSQSLAYAEAASLVHFLVAERGAAVIPNLLATLQQEGDLDRTMERVLGRDTAQLESSWRRSVSRRWRWPLLLQSPVLPFGLMLLLFIAGYLRYRRDRRRRQEKMEEDW